MQKLHVAVLRGGPSSEYDVSLKTGAHILRNMPEKYQAHDIFISRSSVPAWHRDGAEREPERALLGIDVVVNALHGQYGEDGKVQQILRRLSIPHTGSDAVASALAMNKHLAKQAFAKQGIRTPYYTYIQKTDPLEKVQKFVFERFLLPFVVKPVTAGSSLGVTIVKNFQNLGDALQKAFEHAEGAIIEEYIRGIEATVGVINNFRGAGLYSLIPTEIKHDKEYYDFESKYSAQSSHVTPGGFSPEVRAALEQLAKRAHEVVGARQYSRSDFIVNPRRGIYLLETNTQPALTPESSFTHALTAIGSNLGEFLDHIITLARES